MSLPLFVCSSAGLRKNYWSWFNQIFSVCVWKRPKWTHVNFPQVLTASMTPSRTWRDRGRSFSSSCAGSTSFLCCHWWVREEVSPHWLLGTSSAVSLCSENLNSSSSISVSCTARPCSSQISLCLYMVDYKELKINDSYTYPAWAYGLGWAMTLSSVLMVPLWAAGLMWVTPGSFTQVRVHRGVLVHISQEKTKRSGG